MKDRNKKIILGVTIAALLILVLGVTYAAYTFTNSGSNQELVVGDIYMHYKEGEKQISIPEAIPSSTYDESKYFEFTIDGKNTYTEKDIWYEIDLSYGDPPEDASRTERIKDKLLKFTLTETKGDVTETVVSGASYQDLQGKKLWVNKIEKGTDNEVNITYKLYMWISDKTVVGNTEDADYSTDVWNDNVFASIKIDVKGDFTPKTIDEPDGDAPIFQGLAKYILDKAYTNTSELIAIDNSGNKCKDLASCAGNIREYRYIGPTVNNYVYLKSDNNANETWRIIGLFLNDAGTEWNVKVVRDEVLPESYLPATYVINDASINGSTKKVTYTIKHSSTPWMAFWNENNSGTELNRWEEAGLQYFLNTETDCGSNKGYLSYLSSDTKALLVEKTYTLGSIHVYPYPTATPKEAYAQERDVESCADGKGPSANSSQSIVDASTGCKVWSGNAAKWTGKVALMYPSDYGLSATEANWTTPMYASSGASFDTSSVNSTTWMYSTMADPKSKSSWFLSPSSRGSTGAPVWWKTGSVSGSYGVGSALYVRPVLNLSSQATRLSGEGNSGSPYTILG